MASRNNRELRPQELRRRCEQSIFDFETTDEVKPLDEFIGQERAVKALELGLGIKDFRYNIYVAGGPGTGKNSIVKAFLERISADEKTPPDLCYVHNFEDPYSPVYLELPAGQGCKFQREIKRMIERLRRQIPTAFASKEYQERRHKIDEEAVPQRNKLLLEFQEQAEQKGFKLELTDMGFKKIPLMDGQPMREEQFARLTERQKLEIEKRSEEIDRLLEQLRAQLIHLEEQREQQMKLLDQDIAAFTVKPLIQKLLDNEKYTKLPLRPNTRVIRYLNAVCDDILAHIDDFKSEPQAMIPSPMAPEAVDKFRKYEINVLVDHSRTKGAPVVVQDNATYPNLFGKIERRIQFGGILAADFTLIKPGSLHEANGGYLVLSADNLFKYPMSWEALKIAIKCKRITIEDPATMLGFTASEGLRPEPIPLEVKVIIIGSPELYHLLQFYDEDFKELFNVKSDFDDQIDWDEKYIKKFGAFIRARCEEREGLLPFHKSGVVRVVEYAAELTGDQKKISARFSDLMTIIREASYWAQQDGKAQYVTAEHVEKAIEEKIYRSNLIEEKIRELIARGDILVEVEGEAVGQVNGLSVYDLGDFSFGKPVRITANVYTGKEGLINIEREAELSGKLHTKGLLILKGWLGEKFAHDKPLSLSASVTFEQSYATVDGDSASSTELYAIISALSGVPIKQGIAVTGSVNQKGETQPIGGVNEKIEGFFAVCKIKGLTGEQGVIIPEQNKDNLMLKPEIIEAVKKKRFHIWAVKNIDEGIEILTGQKAGQRLKNGEFEKGTVYYKADMRLREIHKKLSEEPEKEEEEE